LFLNKNWTMDNVQKTNNSDWIPVGTCCANSPLTMQTSCATAVLRKKYQNSSDFMQQIVQIVNQHHTRSTSCTTRSVAQHD
jgi:hypothetical protein